LKYGEATIRRALGYITASRNGITNNEMEDLLSLDDAVMDEVAIRFTLNRPSIYNFQVPYMKSTIKPRRMLFSKTAEVDIC
jgi:hypothetical protein